MSVEQVDAFIEKMKSDIEFEEHVMAIQDVVERLQFINEKGYDFSMEEITNVGNSIRLSNTYPSGSCYVHYRPDGEVGDSCCPTKC